MKTTITLIGALAMTAGTAYGQCNSKKHATCSSTKTTEVALGAMSNSGKHNIVETAKAAGSFETLLAAAKAAGLADALASDGPFTVFAPTDDAFAKLPKGTIDSLLMPKNKGLLQSILKHHVVSGRVLASDVVGLNAATTLSGQRVDFNFSGDGVMVDNANILSTDIECTNGVIHVIDSVIMPSTNDIVATAVEAGSFNTLAAALQAAGLVETLQGKGPFTVFAPTDEAFANLSKGTVESLLKPENKHKLQDVLKYHVVSGRIYADDAASAGIAGTVVEQPVRIRIRDGRLFVNDAKVIKTDIDASNGVIHVIDSVLLPN